MGKSLWQRCLAKLECELPPQQFSTWIRPLHAVEEDRNLKLLAPNRFVLEWIKDKYLERIVDLVTHLAEAEGVKVLLSVGSHSGRTKASNTPQCL
ncbi:MAG: DnaA N-terminal domain-containing protein, partial [Gammaproteobacteria bacterium]